MSDGSNFLGRSPKETRFGWRPVARTSFGGQRRTDAPFEAQDRGMDAYEGATERVKQRLDKNDGWKLFGVAPPPTVEDRAEQDLIDKAIGAEVEKVTYGRPSRVERDRAYLQRAREDRVEAEKAAKTARREAREAKQEARDAKLREWFDGKTDEEVSAYLASEGFDKLSDQQQAVIYGVLDEIREGNEAEVDIALEEADNESFEFAEAESTDDDESFAWLDEHDDDDDPGLTGENYTKEAKWSSPSAASTGMTRRCHAPLARRRD
jgi:hypothetical protein